MERVIDVDWIRRICEEQKYDLGVIGNSPRVAIVGEMHDTKEFQEQQERLIDRLRPQFFIHEFAGIRIYNPFRDIEGIPKGRKVNKFDVYVNSIPDYLINWAKKYNAILIGNDLSQREIDICMRMLPKKFPDRYVWNEEIEDVEYKDKEGLKDEGVLVGPTDKEIMACRDSQMGKVIVKYAEKTERPLVAIMGAAHIAQGNNVHLALRDKGIDYACINQAAAQAA